MYCPKCGTQNVEDINFCRSCGLDLGTIARVMEKHLPQALLEKIDEQILNPKKSELYNSLLTGGLAIAFLIAGLAFTNWQYPRDAMYFFIGAAIAAVQSVWYFLIYIRSRSKTKMVLTTADYLEGAGITPEEYVNDDPKAFSVVPKTAQIPPPPARVSFETNSLEEEDQKTKKLSEKQK